MSNANGGFAKPVLLQVATAGELQKCPDFLLGRYNGHPDEDLSELVLDNRGADLQWFYKDHQGRTHSGWPVKVRANRYVAIPNCKENLEILEHMSKQKWSKSVRTESGVIEKTIEHPPLYELVQEEVAQVSASAILAAFAAMSDEDKARLFPGMVQQAPSATAPQFTLDEAPVVTRESLEATVSDAQAVLENPESTKEDKKAAGARKRDAEAELAKLV